MITLVKDTIDNQDLDRLIEWLRTNPRLTKGEQTVLFEQKWADWVGTKYSVFVNSGSSALLLMYYSLLEMGVLATNDKVVVPSLCWATDLSPTIQFNLKPILCDINLKNLSVDLNHLEDIFIKEKPKALMLVSVLGFSPDMKTIVHLCEKYGVMLLEDVCESTGSKFGDKKLGTFGQMSAFSCYFGHHFSTIEGGFINTNSSKIYNILKMLRSHGWSRDLDISARKQMNIPEQNSFENLYKFYVPGFNLRSTDLQAFIGLNQIEKLDSAIEIRNKNYLLLKQNIKNEYWSMDDGNNFISNFGFPIIHPKRSDIIEAFYKNKVEIRPLICGSMGNQPMYVKRYGKKELKNASIADKYGCYIPNHPKLTEEEINKMVSITNEALDNNV